jgi:hypothetical protein
MALVGGAGSEDTPLQEKLADMAAAIGKVGAHAGTGRLHAHAQRGAFHISLVAKLMTAHVAAGSPCAMAFSEPRPSATPPLPVPIDQVGFGVAVLSFIALIIKWFVTWCRCAQDGRDCTCERAAGALRDGDVWDALAAEGPLAGAVYAATSAGALKGNH